MIKKTTPSFALKIPARAQSLLEFALALPILLMLLFGIIEFGRLLQAWLALQNGARFGVRYALTGSYNAPTYCGLAGDALGLRTKDAADGSVDCRITKDNSPTDFEDETHLLEDWARLASIRDAAIAGATGVSWDPASNISGDYIGYLSDSDLSAYSNDFRGDPSNPAFFYITTCSSRRIGDGSFFQLDYLNKRYVDGHDGDALYEYPPYCQRANSGGVLEYFDDPGGPGDRVKVILSYRHQLITPFLSSWWPTLDLSAEREGLVEKFRQSRVTGLTGSNPIANTWTWTPTVSSTPIPPTFTALPNPCDGNAITKMVWNNVTTSSDNNLWVGQIYSNAAYPFSPNLTSLIPEWVVPSSTTRNYFQRINGMLCVPYSGEYVFRMKSDDHSKLFIDRTGAGPVGKVEILSKFNNWTIYTESVPISMVAGQLYYIEVLHRQGTGDSFIELQWKGPGVQGGTGLTKTPGTHDFVTLLDDYVYPPPPEATLAPNFCDGTGILAEYWSNIAGTSVDNLRTAIPNFPAMPDGSFINNNYEFPIGSTSWSNNYGAMVHGYLCAPVTGYYNLAIASDDRGELWLSPDLDPANANMIAYTTGATGFRIFNATAQASNQRSSPIYLEANRKYYIRAIYKEGSGSDYVSIAWSIPNQAPDQVILQRYIEPGTPMPTFSAQCEDVVATGSEPLIVNGNRIEIPIANNNRVYPMQITAASGTWQNTWHDEVAPQNPAARVTAAEIRTRTATVAPTYIPIAAGEQVVLNPPAPKSWTATSGSANPIVSFFRGIFSFLFDPSLATRTYQDPLRPTQLFQYYHGDDFDVTIYYWIQNPDRLCTLNVTGAAGPDVDPVYLRTVIPGSTPGTVGNGFINVAAAVNAPRGLNRVYFTVFKSDGTMVGYYSVNPTNNRIDNGQICMFGRRSNTECNNRQVERDVWRIDGVDSDIIKSGETYTIYIIAEDNGAPRYSARDFLNIVPTGALATLDTRPSNTPRPPTNTPTVTVFVTTAVPPPSNTPTNTLVPSATPLPTNTVQVHTPTPSASPTDLGPIQGD